EIACVKLRTKIDTAPKPIDHIRIAHERRSHFIKLKFCHRSLGLWKRYMNAHVNAPGLKQTKPLNHGNIAAVRSGDDIRL
ncbi:MAG: hypothetical protein JWQ35_1016, partial [Bacteriovoracaceae bacterium]|nr:hypothetical protein [Bacteriovoracaceae bacterium]